MAISEHTLIFNVKWCKLKNCLQKRWESKSQSILFSRATFSDVYRFLILNSMYFKKMQLVWKLFIENQYRFRFGDKLNSFCVPFSILEQMNNKNFESNVDFIFFEYFHCFYGHSLYNVIMICGISNKFKWKRMIFFISRRYQCIESIKSMRKTPWNLIAMKIGLENDNSCVALELCSAVIFKNKSFGWCEHHVALWYVASIVLRVHCIPQQVGAGLKLIDAIIRFSYTIRMHFNKKLLWMTFSAQFWI